MPDPSTLIPFVISSAILVLIPGPAVLYIVSTGIGRGRLEGKRDLIAGMKPNSGAGN